MPHRPRFTWLFVAIALVLVAGAVWSTRERSPVMGDAIVTPPYDELRTFAATRIFFGHQSVGANIIAGLESTYAGSSDSTLLTVVETREPAAGESGIFAHAPVGANGDPYRKLADFTAILDGPVGSRVDVALLKLCYADVVAGTDVEALFAAYESMLADLAIRHPDVRFLAATVPLTTDRSWKSTLKSWLGDDDRTGPADNVARARYNALVRARFAATGDLYDIAAVEATLPESPMERRSGAATYHVLNADLAADAGHLNDLGSRLAAAELIRLVARGG
ncbi:MAG TPA: hypothetical protein VLS51_03190 [Propionibacteriaceae bacterium]|nr:hypothetical protein [Propionibacteriaceae bacterium]